MPLYLSNPDYAIHPGSLLKEHLEAYSLSVDEFSRRCGHSPELIEEIISGSAPLDRDTAHLFENEFGVSENIWLGIEAEYQEKKLRDAEKKSALNLGSRAVQFIWWDCRKTRICTSRMRTDRESQEKFCRLHALFRRICDMADLPNSPMSSFPTAPWWKSLVRNLLKSGIICTIVVNIESELELPGCE